MDSGSTPRRAQRSPGFQPRVTLGILYVAAFFLAWSLLLVAPELWRVLETVPPGPTQQEIASRVAREAVRARFGVALAAALATTGLGIYMRALPGMRER